MPRSVEQDRGQRTARTPVGVNALCEGDLGGSHRSALTGKFVGRCAVPAQTRAPRTRFSLVYLRIRRWWSCVSRSGSAVSTWNNFNRPCKGACVSSATISAGASAANSFVRGCVEDTEATFLFLEEKKILRALCLSVADPTAFFYRLSMDHEVFCGVFQVGSSFPAIEHS